MQGGQGAAVMRGPIATKVINQMVHATEWGDIDYMVLTKAHCSVSHTPIDC